jgi:hypothetical protein
MRFWLATLGGSGRRDVVVLFDAKEIEDSPSEEFFPASWAQAQMADSVAAGKSGNTSTSRPACSAS